MKKYIFFLFALLCFLQIQNLNAFSNNIFVFNKETKLCGLFSPGDSSQANWLQEWWQAISLDAFYSKQLSSTVSCFEWREKSCCKELWLRYAWVAIWVQEVSEERRSAEFLANKGIINKNNLIPDEYKLSHNISRKEAIKIIMIASKKNIEMWCKEMFQDSPVDWSCKYIENALKYNYISGNKNFYPNRNISILEATKLIFKSRGIEKEYNTWYWQQDYISTAYYKGFFEEKPHNYNTSITRWEMFLTLARTYNDFKNW